eukprot:c6763_g1_i1.p1 GENE.c6763_g1_i1~~c6763_g1_i1.p1  ORF type:complete len:189 (+),score=19.58 c6763_g1_i1:1-567(+)
MGVVTPFAMGGKSSYLVCVVTLLLFQLLAITITLVFVNVLKQSTNWPSTSCAVSSKRVDRDCDTERCSFRATVVVTYTSPDSPQGSVTTDAHKYASKFFMESEADAHEFIEDFTVGQSYKCWYDPHNHQTVKLSQDTFPVAVKFCLIYFVLLGCVSVMCYIAVWDKEKLEIEREMADISGGRYVMDQL